MALPAAAMVGLKNKAAIKAGKQNDGFRSLKAKVYPDLTEELRIAGRNSNNTLNLNAGNSLNDICN
jgi:hypothetical protein